MKGILLLIILFISTIADAQDKLPDIQKIEQYLDEMARDDEFSGVVLIAKDGIPVLRKAYGMANLNYDIPNTPDTKFNLASMNKMFTGVAVMQLVEQGKIDLQAKVGKYLPHFHNEEVVEKITVHQLLTHTSGMGSYWTDEYFKTSKDLFKDLKDYIPLFADQPLQFEPGSKFNYSNAGYMMLGLIIEAVTSQSYFDYVRDYIYHPLGMKNTDAYELDHPLLNLAIGYTLSKEKPGQYKNNNYMHIVKGGPAGGGYSTVDDLLLFANAVNNNILLKPETTRLMTTGKAADNTYGYGFGDHRHNNYRYIGHTGGFAGIANELFIMPETGYTVVLLTNRDNGYKEARNYIMQEIAGPSPETEQYLLSKKIIRTAIEDGYESAVKLIDKKNGNKIKINEQVINNAGYVELVKGNYNNAIAIFRINTFAFPDKGNPYDSLGEGYYFKGDLKSAKTNYKKALELDPENTNAQKMLEKIEAALK